MKEEIEMWKKCNDYEEMNLGKDNKEIIQKKLRVEENSKKKIGRKKKKEEITQKAEFLKTVSRYLKFF